MGKRGVHEFRGILKEVQVVSSGAQVIVWHNRYRMKGYAGKEQGVNGAIRADEGAREGARSC